MALTGLTGTMGATLSFTLTETCDFADSTRSPATAVSKAFTFGTGAAQCNKFFIDQRTLSGSGNETLDLQSLTNNTGSPGLATVFTGIKVFYIEVVSTNSDSTITVGAGGSNAFNSIFGGDDTFTVIVRPGGGMLVWDATTAAGYTVSATVKDLKIVNNSSSSLTYNIQLYGIG